MRETPKRKKEIDKERHRIRMERDRYISMGIARDPEG